MVLNARGLMTNALGLFSVCYYLPFGPSALGALSAQITGRGLLSLSARCAPLPSLSIGRVSLFFFIFLSITNR